MLAVTMVKSQDYGRTCRENVQIAITLALFSLVLIAQVLVNIKRFLHTIAKNLFSVAGIVRLSVTGILLPVARHGPCKVGSFTKPDSLNRAWLGVLDLPPPPPHLLHF